MPTVFRCKTQEGYVFKILGELLQNNIRVAHFEIDSTGIRLRMMDSNSVILLDLMLDSNKFTVYKYVPKNKNDIMRLGISMSHFHKMLKTIKKKDSIELFIDDESPNDLGIKIIPEKNNRVTISHIKIQLIQNLDIELPTGYDRPVIVPSTEFQKMCKSFSHISSPHTRIFSKKFMIRFSGDDGGLMKRSTEFGETEDSDDDEEDDDKSTEEDYEEDFVTEHLTRVTKISGLHSNMQIFVKKNLPMLISSDIGSLGKISIYLKSKNFQDEESRSVECKE